MLSFANSSRLDVCKSTIPPFEMVSVKLTFTGLRIFRWFLSHILSNSLVPNSLNRSMVTKKIMHMIHLKICRSSRRSFLNLQLLRFCWPCNHRLIRQSLRSRQLFLSCIFSLFFGLRGLLFCGFVAFAAWPVWLLWRLWLLACCLCHCGCYHEHTFFWCYSLERKGMRIK